MYKDIRFAGHYIHDTAGYERAQETIAREMRERKPDANAPSGYAPDDSFKKEASRFGDQYRELRDDMLQRARGGKPVSRDEYVTLVRAERVYIESNSGPGLASHRLSLLEAGKNPFGSTGMSDTRLIGKLTGHDLEGPRDNGSRFNISISHRP